MGKGRFPAAVVFYLDGTLIDSLPDIVAAANRLLDEDGRRPITRDEARLMVGAGAGALVERAFAITGAPLDDAALAVTRNRFIAYYEQAPARESSVYPGVIPVLEALAADRVPLGVCTNKPHALSETVLAALGLARFMSAVAGADAVAAKKPDAGHVLAVLDAMGGGVRGAVLVGDSATDMAAARNAGIPSVAVSYGYSHGPAAELDCDALIDSFADLPRALDTLAP